MERNLALEVVRATEAAALASARFIGKGDEQMADRVAAEAMRNALNSVAMDGKVVVGEGDQGAAELLYSGEIVGTGVGPEVDVALDALEGALICATGGPNALACIALAERGKILRCPDTYMDKIACGPTGRGIIDLDRSPTDNLKAFAEAKDVYVEDLRVAILDRPRHEKLIAEFRRDRDHQPRERNRPDARNRRSASGRACGRGDSVGRRRDAGAVLTAQRAGSRGVPPVGDTRLAAQVHARRSGGRECAVRRDRHHDRRLPARGALFLGRREDEQRRDALEDAHDPLHRSGSPLRLQAGILIFVSN